MYYTTNLIVLHERVGVHQLWRVRTHACAAQGEGGRERIRGEEDRKGEREREREEKQLRICCLCSL